MVLRLYNRDSCVDVFKDINRLVCNELGNIEFRVTQDKTYLWKSRKSGVDYDSFILSTE